VKRETRTKRVLYVSVNPAIVSVAECARLFRVSSPAKAAEFEQWAETASPGQVWSGVLYESEYGIRAVRGRAVMLASSVPANLEL
jgi:hypothetical protein